MSRQKEEPERQPEASTHLRRRDLLTGAVAFLSGPWLFGGSRIEADTGSPSREVRRRARSTDHSLLFWKTWLLDGIFGIGDKPQYEERTGEVGRGLERVGYDTVALC